MPDVEKLRPEDRAALLGCVKRKNDAWAKENNVDGVTDEINQKHFSECAASLGLENYDLSGFAKSADLETGELHNVEIAAAGMWTSAQGKKKTYTVDDLKEMVSNFYDLKKNLPPFFKFVLDHVTPEQHRQFVGQPSIGWIQDMRVSGSKILADFVKVPKKIMQLINAGAYRRISPEIIGSLTEESTGKVYRNVLQSAALLGAKWGAMTTLADVQNLYESPEWAQVGRAYQLAEVFEAREYSNNPEGGEDDMDKEEVKKLIDAAVDPLKKEHADFQAGIASALGIEAGVDPVKAIAALKAENEAKGKEVAERDKADFEAKMDAVIDKAKADGKLLPANEPAARLMFNSFKSQADESGKVSFAMGDKTIEGTVLECAKAYFDAQPKAVELGRELGGKGLSGGEKTTAGLPDDVLRNMGRDGLPARVINLDQVAEVEKYQQEYKCDYLSAFTAKNGGFIPAEPSPEMGALYSFNDKTGEMTAKG